MTATVTRAVGVTVNFHAQAIIHQLNQLFGDDLRPDGPAVVDNCGRLQRLSFWVRSEDIVQRLDELLEETCKELADPLDLEWYVELGDDRGATYIVTMFASRLGTWETLARQVLARKLVSMKEQPV